MNQEEIQNEESHSEVKHRRSKKHIYIPILVVGFVVVVIAAALAWLYTGNLSDSKKKVFASVPLPAAFVDMKLLSANTVIERVELAKKLVAAQGAESTVNPEDTYDQIIESKKLEAVASQKHLSVSKEAIDEEYNNIITQYANGDAETFKNELAKTYEMTPEEFKDQVIYQELVNAQLMLWYNEQEDLNKDNYKIVSDLKAKVDAGENFDDVARSYTQDEATRDFAGDSGMLPFNDLLPEFREALADVKVGDVKFVPSRYGLHILKVLEYNNDGENGAKQIHLQQIFVKQAGFTEWIATQTDNVRVIKLLKFT